MDIDRRLHEAGQRWRESQGPALQPPSAASLGEAAPPRQWRRGLAPMAAAAAVAVIILGLVSLHGATTGSRPLPAGSVTTPTPSVSSTSTKPSTSAARAAAAAVAAAEAARARAAAEAEIARRLPNTVTAPPAAACVGSQLRPSLGTAGPAMGTGHTQVLLQNVSGQGCHLGGVFPLQGVTTSGTATRLVFPGDSATSYPSPVVPGNVAPRGFGAFWVTTQLNGCPNGARFASLVIELSPQQHVQMPWPTYMSNGCLAAESAAGPFPQPIPSIP